MSTKKEEKAVKKSFIHAEREALRSLSPKDKEDALVMLSSYPVKTYLIGVLDELIRQGIYLSPEKQEGAKLLVEIIGGELQKGYQIIKKRETLERKT